MPCSNRHRPRGPVEDAQVPQHRFIDEAVPYSDEQIATLMRDLGWQVAWTDDPAQS